MSIFFVHTPYRKEQREMKEVHQSTHDTILAEYEAKKAKKEAAKATMIQKAWTYKKVTHSFFVIACLAAAATMSLTFVHILLEQPLFTPILIGAGAVTVVSALVFLVSIISKKIWEHHLLKLGLMLPPELD